MVSLKEITVENFWDIIDLKVADNQTDLVASVKRYERFGFQFMGQVFGKEHIMCLAYGKASCR